MTTTTNNLFASLIERVHCFHKSGDLRLPLYTLTHPRFVEFLEVFHIRGKERTKLVENQYEIDEEMLVIKIPILEEEIINWSFYAN